MGAIPPGELEATVEARKELGAEREAEVLAGFLDRVEQGIDRRIDEHLRHRVREPRAHTEQHLKLALGSIALGIGATAVANGMGGAGIAVAIVAWVANALVNLAYALHR
jgi:hypothetical protein